MKYVHSTADHIGGLKQVWNGEWAHAFPMRERLLEQNVLQDRNVLGSGTRVAIDVRRFLRKARVREVEKLYPLP